MNTKGIKFLAVLAVLAMAFAAFAIIATNDDSDAEEVATDVSTAEELTTALTTAAKPENVGNTYTLTMTGSFTAANNTVIGSNVILRIASGQTLTIASGQTLTNNGEIRDLGTFTNNGTFNNYAKFIVYKDVTLGGNISNYDGTSKFGTIWAGVKEGGDGNVTENINITVASNVLLYTTLKTFSTQLVTITINSGKTLTINIAADKENTIYGIDAEAAGNLKITGAGSLAIDVKDGKKNAFNIGSFGIWATGGDLTLEANATISAGTSETVTGVGMYIAAGGEAKTMTIGTDTATSTQSVSVYGSGRALYLGGTDAMVIKNVKVDATAGDYAIRTNSSLTLNNATVTAVIVDGVHGDKSTGVKVGSIAASNAAKLDVSGASIAGDNTFTNSILNVREGGVVDLTGTLTFPKATTTSTVDKYGLQGVGKVKVNAGAKLVVNEGTGNVWAIGQNEIQVMKGGYFIAIDLETTPSYWGIVGPTANVDGQPKAATVGDLSTNKFVFGFTGDNAKDSITIKNIYSSYPTAVGVDYTLAGAVTLGHCNSKGFDWFNNKDTVTIASGTVTLQEVTSGSNLGTVINENVVVTMKEGAKISGAETKKLVVNGTLIYAEAAQAYTYVTIGTNGKIDVAGEGGSEQKVVVDNTIADGKINADTFNKEGNKNATVIVTTNAISEAKVPEGKSVVINANPAADAVLDVSAANSSIAVNTTGASSFTVKTSDTQIIKLNTVTGSFTFSKGSIIVEAGWTSGTIYLNNGDELKLSGSITGAVVHSVLMATDAPAGSTAKLIVESGDDKSLTIGTGATLSVGAGISVQIDGTVAGEGTMTVAEKTVMKGKLTVTTFNATKDIDVYGEATGTINNTAKVIAHEKSNINAATITGLAKLEGKDANGGSWTTVVAAGNVVEIVLNNYNGNYNFAKIGATNNLATITLVGDNVLTYNMPKTPAATVLGGTGLTKITTDDYGTLKLNVNISKVENSKLNTAIVVIKAGELKINGVTVDIKVTGTNSAWTEDMMEEMNITAISATSLNLFKAPLIVENMSGFTADHLNGIVLTGTLDVSTGSLAVEAVKALDVDGQTTMQYAFVTIKGDADLAAVDIINESTATFVGKLTTTGLLKVTQVSILTILDADIKGDVSNKGSIGITGDVLVTGTFTNEATLVNDGVLGIYGAYANNDGTFTNNGTFKVFGKKFTDAECTIKITDVASGDAGKVRIDTITISKITANADGTADVKATVSFYPAVTLKDGTTEFVGTLTPSTDGSYTLTISNGTATISVAFAEVAGGSAEVGSNFTVGAYGAIVTSVETTLYLEANTTKTSTTAGATVTDGLAAKIIDSEADFDLTKGTIVNDGIAVVSSSNSAVIIGTNGTYQGDLVTEIPSVTISGAFNGNLASAGDTLVTIGKAFTGNIIAASAITVSGTMNGNILADGDVIISATKAMTGDIATTGNVSVLGTLDGNVLITTGTAAKEFTVGGKFIGDLKFISEYKATKDATVKSTETHVMSFDADMTQDPAKTFVINLTAAKDATGSEAGAPGCFGFGALNAPSATKSVKLTLTEGKLGVPTASSITLPERFELVIMKDTTIEVAKTATLNVKSSAMKVSSEATANFETGTVATTYGLVQFIMSFSVESGAYTIYSDVAYALSQCEENSELTVGSNAPINSNVSVKKGVNIIADNVTLTFNGYDVKMDEGAMITLVGTGNVIFKKTIDNKDEADADESLDYKFYTVSAVVVYGDNAVAFDGVRFTNDSTIIGVAATSTAAAKISTTLLYNEGIAKIAEGYGTGSITIDNTAYYLTKADKEAGKLTDFFATFCVGAEAVFDAVSIKDAFGVVDYDIKDGKVFVDEIKLNPTLVAVEGTLNLLNNTEVKGAYSGLGTVTLAAGKEFKFVESDVVPDVAKDDQRVPGGAAVLTLVDTTDDQNGYVFNLVGPKAGSSLTFQATTYKIGSETYNVMTVAGSLGNGSVIGEAAFIKQLTIEKEGAVVGDYTYVIGAGKSTATGYVGAKAIYMKDTDKDFQELEYKVSFEKEGYTFYTQLATIDWDEITDITVEKDLVLADDLDLSGKDVTIEVAEDATLTIPANKKLVIGTPLDSIGTYSVLSGNVKIMAGAFVVAYSDVDFEDAVFIDADGTKKVKSSTFTIEDILYATAFANSVTGPVSFAKASEDLVPEIEGYVFTTWYLYNEKALDLAMIGETNAYAGAKAVLVYVTVKFVEGVSYYCNGVEFAIYDTPTKVEYDSVFTAKINNTAKYEGTPVINGKNSFIVTEDSVLVASGVNPIPVPPEPEPEPVVGDSGLSLTDILLIVLVILIAIMVVILVLRLNRS